ncbi:MAG: CBS domain-containing protein [bacterium]
MLVRDILESKPRDIISVHQDVLVKEAMELLISNKISCLPIMDDSDKLIGVVSDKDIFRLIYSDQAKFSEVPIKEIMSTDLIVGLVDDEVDYIAGVMTENRIRHIPIVEGEKLIGLVSQGDVVKKQMKSIQVENRYLRMYIDGTHSS